MNSSAQILSHDVQRCVTDGFARANEGCGWNDDREDGHKLAATSNAVVDADTSTTSILNFSNLTDEKFGHDERVENIAASHSNSPPLSNDEDHAMPRGTVINIIDAPAKIRFRGASCVVSEHSTRNTTTHRGVAA